MVRESASSKTPIKSFTASSTTASWRDKDSFTLQQEIITLENSDLIKNKEEVFILGLARKATFIKESSKEGKEMEEELSGGQMAAGTREISEMECKVAGACFSERADTCSMKAIGIMECSMVKELNISRTVSAMRAPLNRTSFTVREYSTRTIL